jgi:hypothetical protein
VDRHRKGHHQDAVREKAGEVHHGCTRSAGRSQLADEVLDVAVRWAKALGRATATPVIATSCGAVRLTRCPTAADSRDGLVCG